MPIANTMTAVIIITPKLISIGLPIRSQLTISTIKANITKKKLKGIKTFSGLKYKIVLIIS